MLQFAWRQTSSSGIKTAQKYSHVLILAYCVLTYSRVKTGCKIHIEVSKIIMFNSNSKQKIEIYIFPYLHRHQ